MQVPATADSLAAQAAAKTADSLQYTLKDLIDAANKLPHTGIWIAVTLGLMLLLIGWFGGTRFNIKQIFFSILLAILVAIFGLPVPMWILAALLNLGFVPPALALLFVFLIWVVFILSIAISVYETFIVTIKEQFGSGR